MTRTRRAILVCLAVAGLAVAPLALASPASADVDDFEFESMDVDFTLGRDADGHATLRVVETIVAVFPEFDQNRGIIRDLPTDVAFGPDERVDIGVDVVSVTDEHGDPVPYEESRWTDVDSVRFVSLALGTDDYVHGRTTYVIEWAARDVVAEFEDDGVEFYWDVNGTGWGQPFGRVSADVHLDDGLSGALTGAAACYRGVAGGTDRCDLERTADGFSVAETDLLPGENVTIAIGFEPGTFIPGTPIQRHWMVAIVPWVLLGVLALLAIGIVVMRRTIYRHAPGRGIIIPQYEGPDDLGIMHAAELVGRAEAGLAAQLVRFAVSGVARLVEDPDAPESSRYRLDLVDVSAAPGRDDTRALRKLFGAKHAVEGRTLVLDRTDRKLGDRIVSLRTQVHKELRSRGYLERRRSPLRRLIFWPAFAVFLATIGVLVFAAIHDIEPPLLQFQVWTALPASLIVMGFSGAPERRSERGTEVYERLLGLRDYLRLAEADRMRVLQSPQGAVRQRIDPGDDAAVVKLYEELLPWAIVWGVEKEWAEVLDARYERTAPTSNLVFATPRFAAVSALGTRLDARGFATTRTSSGSGGSGFSGGSFGGGFSGGGGGGGGGGGR